MGTSNIKVVCLGAGQDVGRSCVLVTLGGRNVMFDCGMHMGYSDERRFPDFSFISKTTNFTRAIDLVIISHFHLDHVGALPYFTEICNYDGPVVMTPPTKAIAPILLEDFRRIAFERESRKFASPPSSLPPSLPPNLPVLPTMPSPSQTASSDDEKSSLPNSQEKRSFFTSEDVKNCMKKVITANLHESIFVYDDLEVKPFYAGHVLGAAMFYVKSHLTGESVVYTGDFNMTPDRHLGGARIDRVRPDLLITETTYATTVRDSRREREREFLDQIYKCVTNGGKVLIPVFALGRAQELCILIESFWDRMNLSVPIYFSAGLVEKANNYYKLFIHWTNQKIKDSFVRRNMFDFRHIRPFDRSLVDSPGPMVLFATPGMLHAGMSLEVFKKWAPSEKNLIILPGYCVAGTVGNKLLQKRQGKIECDKKTTIDVRCGVSHLSFSAHADAKGIIQLIRDCEPRNVFLVHGEKEKMEVLKRKVIADLGIPCFNPPNGATVTIETQPLIEVNLSVNLIKQVTTTEISRDLDSDDLFDSDVEDADDLDLAVDNHQEKQNMQHDQVADSSETSLLPPPPKRMRMEGILISRSNEKPCLYDSQEAASQLGIRLHEMRFTAIRRLPPHSVAATPGAMLRRLSHALRKWYPEDQLQLSNEKDAKEVVMSVQKVLTIRFDCEDSARFLIEWGLEDDPLASKVLSLIDNFIAKRNLLLNQDGE